MSTQLCEILYTDPQNMLVLHLLYRWQHHSWKLWIPPHVTLKKSCFSYPFIYCTFGLVWGWDVWEVISHNSSQM
jgi:hypothetical protein